MAIKPPPGFSLVEEANASGIKPPEGFSLVSDEQSKPEIKQDFPMRRTLSKYLIRPAIEGGAMTIGGAAGAVLGAPAGPIGSGLGAVGMGAAMYPPAHEAANRVDELMGIGGRQKPVGDLERTLGEFQTGLGIETGGKVLGSAVKVGADKLVRGGVPTMLGPSKEAVVARMERPEAIKGAPSYTQQAERLPATLKNISKVIDKLYQRSSGTLRNSPEVKDGAVPLSYVNKMLGGLQEQLKVGQATVGSADQAASSKLGSLVDDMNNIIKQQKMPEIVGPTGQVLNLRPKEIYLPESTVHKLIQRIRKNIDFTDKSATSTNSVLTDVSGQLDAGLKSGNPAYEKSIKPVSKLTRLLKDTAETFSLTKHTGEGFAHTDKTISSLKSLPQERRGASQGLSRRLKAATKEDLVGTSKNRQLAEQFIGGNAQGSRRTLGGGAIGTTLGAGIGAAFGHPTAGAAIGSNVGAMAGMASDVGGREMGARIIDSYMRAKPWLAKLPYEVAVRLISSGVLGGDGE